MIGYVEAPMAWGLTRGMGRVLGVNLADAVIEGWLSRAELAVLVDRCQACDKAEDCTRWLARQVAAETLPAFCPNKAPLEGLVAR
ncbi:MAG: DUF6455 family protein [Rhodobacteraceae bacterium]|jgi:hypothetical protein|nr:DUF6455 family protein [Paracoccaceae bacterium]MCZ8333215.1 DUF6455 family protein [Paracoccaceae bacterium]